MLRNQIESEKGNKEKRETQNDSLKAGVDGSVALIDTGAGKSLDTMNVKDPIVAFLFGQQGLMASATIEGAKFTKLVR